VENSSTFALLKKNNNNVNNLICPDFTANYNDFTPFDAIWHLNCLNYVVKIPTKPNAYYLRYVFCVNLVLNTRYAPCSLRYGFKGWGDKVERIF